MAAMMMHGGGLDAAVAHYGGALADWLDLSTGINANAYPVGQFSDRAWQSLPDERAASRCLDAAREYYCVPAAASLVAAPGTQAIIQWLPYLMPAKTLAIVAPTYNEYAHRYGAAGTRVIDAPDLMSVPDEADIVVVGNPNNPDGRIACGDHVDRLLASGKTVIVDEAFADVMPQISLVSLAAHPQCLVLKSFGKFFGLAGLRLGFAVGAEDTIAPIRAALGPWCVPGPALEIGATAFDDRAWVAAAQHELKVKSERLDKMILKAGLQRVGCARLFLTASHPDSAYIANLLANRHILVRTFDYAPTWIRFGLPGDDAGFARLEAALQEATGAW